MKKYILLFVLVGVAVLGSCDNDSFNNNNKYLPNYNFNITIDTNDPLYGQLKFPSSPVRINTQSAGINGVIVTKVGSGYAAFEASCPNQPLTTCSVLTTKPNDIMAICPCDGVKFNLLTGEATTKVQYRLKPYKVQQVSETVIIISN